VGIHLATHPALDSQINPKIKIKPQITLIDTDFEELTKPKQKASLVNYQICEICEICEICG
jgi:hypothetical protein